MRSITGSVNGIDALFGGFDAYIYSGDNVSDIFDNEE